MRIGIWFGRKGVVSTVMRHRQLGSVGLVMGQIPSAWVVWDHAGLLGCNKPSLAKFSPSI